MALMFRAALMPVDLESDIQVTHAPDRARGAVPHASATAPTDAVAESRVGSIAPRRAPATSPTGPFAGAVTTARRLAIGAWNALAGDDLRTVRDPHAPLGARALAVGDLALNLVPEGKGLELGAKPAARAVQRAAETAAGHIVMAAERTASPLFRGISAEHLASARGAERNAAVARPGYEPPWKADGVVHDGRLLHDDRTTFARVYREVDGEPGTSRAGQWLLRRADIEGKSPTQIKEAYALPSEPTHVVELHLNRGFRIRVGPSGANRFGPGGEEQIQTLTKLREKHLGTSMRLPL